MSIIRYLIIVLSRVLDINIWRIV